MRSTRRRWNGLRLCALVLVASGTASAAPLPGGTLDPTAIAPFVSPLVIPPVMPPSAVNVPMKGGAGDTYDIAARQFQQQILPAGFPKTTVWGYGSVVSPGTVEEGGSFNYPAFTIEARWRKPTRVRWINDLEDENGDPLPHLLPIDQTLHWANPLGDCRTGIPRPDCAGSSQMSYGGPVPIVVHVHGADTFDHSDGYPEAWFLPGLAELSPGVQFSKGSLYDAFRLRSPLGASWDDVPGSAVFIYPNDQRATTLWYHDHALGITRNNVYAGLAGFYLLRGGPADVPGRLPGPAPALGDPPGIHYREIPIVIQDRSFNDDGSLFYPDNRAFFEGLAPDDLQIPFIPDPAIGGPSDVPPIWNPEFFGNTLVVNGRTWPYLEVEQRRYRFRFLNGSNARFLILRMENGLPFWQIGAEGGFLPAPVQLDELLMAPAERADVIVDFSNVPAGTSIVLQNFGPDEPFGGGVPEIDFEPADPATTGRAMQFRVVPRVGPDSSLPPQKLALPKRAPLGPEIRTRMLGLFEEDSQTVLVSSSGDTVVLDPAGTPFGPVAAFLGTVDGPLAWSAPITENPGVGETEVWELHNFTGDAHPIHVHLVQFEVLEREDALGMIRGPDPWETGLKDTVVAYPGEITRIKARFDREGLYVWHCHILEHEDNEMMRSYCVGDSPICTLADL